MATVVHGGTAYTGIGTAVTTHTRDDFSPAFAEQVFNSTTVLKALGSRAWNGVNAPFGNINKTSGRGISFGDGFQFSGKLAVTAPSASLLARGGVIAAAERNDWEGWAYDWKRLFISLGIPEEDIQDNAGKAQISSMLADEYRLGRMGMAKAINDLFLGSADSVAAAVGLPYLVAVNDNAIGGITAGATRTWWRPHDRELIAVGGGGDYDKPLELKRVLEGCILTCSGYASVAGPDLLISNMGAYLTLSRMSERLDGYFSTTKVEKGFYDVGIPHMLVDGRPMVYDAAATVPYGYTSGDFIYGLNTHACGISFKRAEYFRTEKWKGPNARSTQRTYRSNIFCRCTPYIKDRRSAFIIHGMTANLEGTPDS